MLQYQQCVMDEKNELEIKRNALREFLMSRSTQNLPYIDVELLVDQERHMTNYLDVLVIRIARFEL